MYFAALLHLKLHSLSFLTVFSDVFRVFYIYIITSSANSDSFTFSFPSWMPFISCSCLIALVSTFNTVLNKIVKSEHPCLDLRRKVLSFFTLEYVIYHTWPYHTWPLLCWGTFLIYLLCWQAFFFNHKWMLNFVRCIFCIEMIIWFLFFLLLMWFIMLIDLWVLNCCLPGTVASIPLDHGL